MGSSVVPKGALVSAAPIATPPIWNATDAAPTLSPAVALIAIDPMRPAARFAGAVRAIVGAVVSAPLGVVPLSPPPPHAARTATPLAQGLAQESVPMHEVDLVIVAWAARR